MKSKMESKTKSRPKSRLMMVLNMEKKMMSTVEIVSKSFSKPNNFVVSK